VERTALLQPLRKLIKPILVDGGYSRFGHTLFILTAEGLITVECRVYDPILGPITYSEKHCRLITEIAGECDSLEENSDLDPDEKLFLFNHGKPDVRYWAFQPKEDASLGEYSFSEDRSHIETVFINHYLGSESASWEAMDGKSLINWVKKIGSYDS